MANTLSIYDPIFYAQEALIALEKSLGMATRVYRGYDKTAQQKGSHIQIKIPSTFSVNDAPSSAQNITTSMVQIVLDQWKEVKFTLTEKELNYTGEQIIADHIRPAAYAIADNIDQALCARWVDIPWYQQVSAGTPVVTDITKTRKVLFDNKVPMHDGNLHMMLDSSLEAGYLGLSAFSQWQGAGDRGVESQLNGSLGSRYGFEIFSNQNAPTGVPGTSADSTGALTADAPKGSTVLSFNAVTSAGTFKPGDIFTLAGDTQNYVVAGSSTVTASGGAVTNMPIYPALVKDHLTNDVIGPFIQDNHVMGLAFHRDAFALAMAPLSELGNQLGAKIASVTDPVTGLSLRSRLYYMPDASQIVVAIDALYGVLTLNPQRAVRMQVTS